MFTKLSVRDNIAAILEERGCGRRAARKGADELLAQFGLVHVTRERASRLSGGEQRRLEIARSLAIRPRFLLFDEPFAGIDPLTVEALHAILVALRASKVGVLLTDHNVRETLTLCDRAYVLFAGRVLAEGPPNTLLASADVHQHFLGDSSSSFPTSPRSQRTRWPIHRRRARPILLQRERGIVVVKQQQIRFDPRAPAKQADAEWRQRGWIRAGDENAQPCDQRDGKPGDAEHPNDDDLRQREKESEADGPSVAGHIR